MSSTQVQWKADGPGATITLSTAEGINVLSTEVLRRLDAALAEVEKQPSVRWAVVQATGKVFAAGADIKEMSNFGASEARSYGQFGQKVLNRLAALPCITVAALHGAALGGGMELALACDFRIAVKSAKLGLPEVTLGLIPGWSGISRLLKLIGPSRAKRLFLSGTPVSAEEACALGAVDEVVNSAEDLTARVAAFCKSFQKASPAAVALAKRAASDGDDIGAFADCFTKADSREGIAAFVEKRSAKWME